MTDTHPFTRSRRPTTTDRERQLSTRLGPCGQSSQTVGRQQSEQVTNHTERRIAFPVEKSMDTHSNRCLVIYRPPGPAACRHQLAGDRPGLFRGQEDRDERDLRSVHHAADGIASRRVRSKVLPLRLFRGYA